MKKKRRLCLSKEKTIEVNGKVMTLEEFSQFQKDTLNNKNKKLTEVEPGKYKLKEKLLG